MIELWPKSHISYPSDLLRPFAANNNRTINNSIYFMIESGLKKSMIYLFKSEFLRYIFSYEFIKQMSLIKVIQENDRRLLLIDWMFIFL